VRETTAKRFFVQQLDMSASTLPNGRKTWDYFDSFEEASAALDIEMAGYAPNDRSSVRQEITDTEAVNATWVRQGDEPWSLVAPLR
jgi:hypothetical protein